MGFIRTVAIVVLSISLFVFVALFGRLPVFRKTPIGYLHRFLLIHIPHAIVALDDRLTGRRITSSLQRFFNYIMNEPHPLVMIFFVGLQVAGEVLFIPPIFEFIPLKPHIITIPLVVMLPYITLYQSHTVRSTVTPSNHGAAMRAYPYDYILYHPNLACKTCHLDKPARSKHCSICKVCVQRQDHHCIWINNCVSRNNYIWFLALLLSMALLLLYASVLGYTALNTVLQRKYVPLELTRGSLTSKKWSTALTWRKYFDAWMLAIGLQPRIGAVTLLAFFTFPLATAFLVYHVYILWAGVTTNESSKWSDLRDDIYEDIVWKARLQDMHKEYAVHSSRHGQATVDLDLYEQKAQWWIIRTRQPVQPTRWTQGGEQEPDQRWQRVRSMNEVDNIYDLGLWENIKDGLFNIEKLVSARNQ